LHEVLTSANDKNDEAKSIYVFANNHNHRMWSSRNRNALAICDATEGSGGVSYIVGFFTLCIWRWCHSNGWIGLMYPKKQTTMKEKDEFVWYLEPGFQYITGFFDCTPCDGHWSPCTNRTRLLSGHKSFSPRMLDPRQHNGILIFCVAQIRRSRSAAILPWPAHIFFTSFVPARSTHPWASQFPSDLSKKFWTKILLYSTYSPGPPIHI
jgi:hypothetical protein